MLPRAITILMIACLTYSFQSQTSFSGVNQFEKIKNEFNWVDSVFSNMTDDQRIGQLLMVRAYSNKEAKHENHILSLIKNYHIGGLCFFQGTPLKQAQLTNKYQKASKSLPLLISMDAEWGLGMRLNENTISYPKQLTLGAIQDNRLIYDMGRQIATDCKRLGVHLNFAPVVDVNNNPQNPVINFRSFGEDIYNVAVKSYKYMQGMQDNGVLACAKHFPGHGDTDVDSHYDLPVLQHNKKRLDSLELMPFRVAIEKGVASIMVGHLHVPNIDNTSNIPTTLSSKAVNQLLKTDLGFEGLVITDGLGMKGVTKHYKPGQTEAEALVAGNDILLLPVDVPSAVSEIKSYLKEGKLKRTDLYKSVKKILHHKYKLNLTNNFLHLISTSNLQKDLLDPKGIALKSKLYQNAFTLVKNKKDLVPISNYDTLKLASISLGANSKTKFQFILDNYANIVHFQSDKKIKQEIKKSLLHKLSNFDIVFASLDNMSNSNSKNYNIDQSQLDLLRLLSKQTKVILTIFGNPYSLKFFDKSQIKSILVAYEQDPLAQSLAAQSLFGVFAIKGRLPISASEKYKFGAGILTSNLRRMGYGTPEEVGLIKDSLYANIEALMQEAIDIKATPGGVVLVAKNGKIIYNKAFGYHTYEKKKEASIYDIWDLASITKVASSTIAIMKLYDQGLIDINQPIYKYLPSLINTNKANLTIADILTHRARLKPWIPFYTKTLVSKNKKLQPNNKWYRNHPIDSFTIPVANRLYLSHTYVDSISKYIYDSELHTKIEYKYSDLGFYLLADIVKSVSGQNIDDFVDKQFYKPLNLRNIAYNPLTRYSKSRIPPTEQDNYFRRQTIQGHVHDMGAAMLGGVSGHAGLFGTSEDLAILFQMLLNLGEYGGNTFLKQEVVRKFTRRCEGCTRRGLGFDMKQLNNDLTLNVSPLTGVNTYGHLGFTGTCVWADPDQQLIYVFLSNRTYPSMSNFKLGKYDFRPRIQSVIYKALMREELTLANF